MQDAELMVGLTGRFTSIYGSASDLPPFTRHIIQYLHIHHTNKIQQKFNWLIVQPVHKRNYNWTGNKTTIKVLPFKRLFPIPKRREWLHLYCTSLCAISILVGGDNTPINIGQYREHTCIRIRWHNHHRQMPMTNILCLSNSYENVCHPTCVCHPAFYRHL